MIEKEKIGLDFVENVTTGMIQTQCRRCCMDKSAEEIKFDENGICNFCHQAQKALKEIENKFAINPILNDILKKGKKNKYDVVIGLSGGADSSTALLKIVELGLRPLCFSIDNGWNDPIADENIMRLVEGLEVPFYRINIDLQKFKELQASFLRAGVINVEIPSDHLIIATAYQMAEMYKIKYIISGGNTATESIMPYSWSYPARDLKHIKAIYKKFAGKKLTGLPRMSLFQFNYFKWIKGIKVVNILDYSNYNRADAIKELEQKFGFKDYGEKHEESIWTKWFQNFYLFKKFGIDKRKAHYSSLINSGQITRQEALDKLTVCPIYPELGIEQRVLAYPKHDHHDYPTDEKLYNFISKVVKSFR